MNELGYTATPTEMKELADVLLRVGTMLMSAGANTGRVRTTVSRISEAFGHKVEQNISQRSIMLTMLDVNGSSIFTAIRVTPLHIVNFKTISGISKMSWSLVADQWTIS